VRGTRSNGAGAALGLPVQRASMWVWEVLVERIAEHVVEEAQQIAEGP
jgi:hypothetical protein